MSGAARPASIDPRLEPRRHGELRLAFFRGVERWMRRAGGRRFYRALHLAPGRFRVREEEVRVPGLPPALDGFLVAHLTDLHGGPFVGAGDLAAVVDAVNAREPDIVALTGDFITRHWSEALPLATDLARLRARFGAFAVFGNHDYKERLEERIVDAYRAAGVRFLRNANARLSLAGAVLAVVGIEDLEEGRRIDLEEARRGLEGSDVELVLCHNPLGAPAIARPGCAAILSGHTHGLQVDLPFLRRLGPNHPGSRVEIGATRVVVNRGLGAIGLPLRIGAPAEVVMVRLVQGAPTESSG